MKISWLQQLCNGLWMILIKNMSIKRKLLLVKVIRDSLVMSMRQSTEQSLLAINQWKVLIISFYRGNTNQSLGKDICTSYKKFSEIIRYLQSKEQNSLFSHQYILVVKGTILFSLDWCSLALICFSWPTGWLYDSTVVIWPLIHTMALRVYWNHSCTIVDNQTFPNNTKSASVAFRTAHGRQA